MLPVRLYSETGRFGPGVKTYNLRSPLKFDERQGFLCKLDHYAVDVGTL